MNANQIINMVMRLFLRKVINQGINAGFDMATRRGGKGKDDPGAAEPQGGQAQADDPRGREAAKRMQKTMRLGRRIGRF